MGQVLEFPLAAAKEPDPEIDLLAAVDFAIRDLHDIVRDCATPATRLQAVQCRLMLERAFEAAFRSG